MSFEASLTWLLLFLLFSLTAKFLKLKPYCGCESCQTFLTSTWSLKYNNLCDWYTHLLSKSPTGTIHIHVLGNVVTSNPQNVEHMLKTKFSNYPKGKPFHAILCDLLGNGIFNVDGHLWKFQRKIASLELGSVSVRSYAFDIINNDIKTRLLPLLSSFVDQNAPLVDLQDVFRRLSFDSICKFSFGVDPKCLDLSLPISEFATAFDLASRLSSERAITSFPLIWKVKRLFNVGSEKQLKEAIEVINDLAYAVIRHKRKTGISSHEDLLSRFMGTIDDDDDDDEFVRDIVVSFLLAGRDTVASALTTFFWLLNNYPNVTQSIRQESSRFLGGDKNQSIKRFDLLRDMHYLNGAVHESMRLFPPVQFDSKFCEQDDVLPDGTFVRSGTRVTFHPYAMGRMETIWGPDCLQFKPERWLENGVFKQKDPFKYPVFQAGPRICLGKEMAIMEIKIVALSLIRRFDIKVVGSGQGHPTFVPGLTATIGGGLPVIVREIK